MEARNIYCTGCGTWVALGERCACTNDGPASTQARRHEVAGPVVRHQLSALGLLSLVAAACAPSADAEGMRAGIERARSLAS